ncbi:choice-of-anchor J domain-containing protein [Tahibacter amnicola]|uniref:Choice-of-anchor J domain-containing protein n=1 Tax=Tahibacter amnicola TaxID=2976241 RepID=A0ABY6BIJ2_9GAMM|nr:choice-of-anchor J domain-containing protein [Tahibacter amnicola]UXI67677.1 choice-of-anchor J domain-containing protein [Tahibacter amnicola]
MKFRFMASAVFSLCVSGPLLAQQLTEGFDAEGLPEGWQARNQSTTVGDNANCWNQAGDIELFASQAGSGQMLANFRCEAADGDISGWLLTPQLTGLQNGNVLTFYTTKAEGSEYADRLEVRLCVGEGCTATGSTGSGAGDVGQFTTLLLTVNPTLGVGAANYPESYTQFSATLTGLPAGTNTGAIAFRYWVTSGGPTGANSDIIGLDTVNLTDTTPVSLQSFSVE